MPRWFSVSGQDNDSYMCGTTTATFNELSGLATCRECGFKLDPFYINPAFRLVRREYDLSFTYDGYCVVSEKFQAECVHSDLTGANFLELPGDPDFLVFAPKTIVEFDGSRRSTRFGQRCTVCGQYDSVAGATPAFLAATPNSDFARTDVLFGSGSERHPLIIASERAKERLVAAKLKGALFHAAAT